MFGTRRTRRPRTRLHQCRCAEHGAREVSPTMNSSGSGSLLSAQAKAPPSKSTVARISPPLRTRTQRLFLTIRVPNGAGPIEADPIGMISRRGGPYPTVVVGCVPSDRVGRQLLGGRLGHDQ